MGRTPTLKSTLPSTSQACCAGAHAHLNVCHPAHVVRLKTHPALKDLARPGNIAQHLLHVDVLRMHTYLHSHVCTLSDHVWCSASLHVEVWAFLEAPVALRLCTHMFVHFWTRPLVSIL